MPERFADYFALQLRFAEHTAAAAAIPLGEAVTRYTNLHRRMGMGDLGQGPPSPAWAPYIRGLEAAGGSEQRLNHTLEVFRGSPAEAPRANPFGCFNCDPPDDWGVLRIHFSNQDSQEGTGPLAVAKARRRLGELRAMFAFVRTAFPSATRVRGGSWLYNLDAYRRLFPPEYGASRQPPPHGVRLTGMSSWGQFLDHREAVKPDLQDRFLQNFETLDIDRPWTAFPLPALQAEAEIGLFLDFYGA